MLCCICLASNPALVAYAYESVLSGSASDYTLLSPTLLHFFFSLSSLLTSFFIYVVALGLFPDTLWTTYLVGEIQLTNYAFSHDKLCHNLGPLLVSLFLFFFSFRVVRLIWLGWVGLGHRKWRGKPHKFVYGEGIF